MIHFLRTWKLLGRGPLLWLTALFAGALFSFFSRSPRRQSVEGLADLYVGVAALALLLPIPYGAVRLLKMDHDGRLDHLCLSWTAPSRMLWHLLVVWLGPSLTLCLALVWGGSGHDPDAPRCAGLLVQGLLVVGLFALTACTVELAALTVQGHRARREVL